VHFPKHLENLEKLVKDNSTFTGKVFPLLLLLLPDSSSSSS